MKTLLSLLLSLALNASYVKWQGDYEVAHREALKQNKSLLVLLVDKEIDLTKKLLVRSFMNQAYVKEINRKYISVLVTKGQKGSYPIELLYTLEYPALFFLDKHELYSCSKISGDLSSEILSLKLKECY